MFNIMGASENLIVIANPAHAGRNEMGSNLMPCASILRLLRSYLPRNDVLILFLEMPLF